MSSALYRLSDLRNGAPLSFDAQNSNPYRIVCKETNGTKTAYYFSSPVYDLRSKKVLDLQFRPHGNGASSVGSHATVTYSDTIRMEDRNGYCLFSLPQAIRFLSERELACGSGRLFPAANGFVYRIPFCGDPAFSLSLEVDVPPSEIRANDHCFALMREKFLPFLTVCTIGVADSDGSVIAPASISFRKLSDRKYTLFISSHAPMGKWILLEANLYEPKIFQDTTVESKHPKTNNAFGSVGFIGTGKELGEQRLYSRPDYSKLSDLNDKTILRAILHLPKLNRNPTELIATRVASRFCSFGSHWANKIAEATPLGTLAGSEHYLSLDLTALLSDKHGRLSSTDGFILKAKRKDAGFAVIATGDSYAYPQILEIHYR